MKNVKTSHSIATPSTTINNTTRSYVIISKWNAKLTKQQKHCSGECSLVSVRMLQSYHYKGQNPHHIPDKSHQFTPHGREGGRIGDA